MEFDFSSIHDGAKDGAEGYMYLHLVPKVPQVGSQYFST